MSTRGFQLQRTSIASVLRDNRGTQDQRTNKGVVVVVKPRTEPKSRSKLSSDPSPFFTVKKRKGDCRAEYARQSAQPINIFVFLFASRDDGSSGHSHDDKPRLPTKTNRYLAAFFPRFVSKKCTYSPQYRIYIFVMTSLYRYLFGSSSSSSTMNNIQRNNRRNNTANSEATTEPPSSGSLRIQTQFPEDVEQHDAAAPSETTSLLSSSTALSSTAAATTTNGSGNHLQDDEQQAKPLRRTAAEQSATDFYFPATNPSIQRYYRFTSTTLTPIAALHRRPATTTTTTNTPTTAHGAASSPGGVTGLLRRSAVVPSHGTDHATAGDWILVSVGGRSGWARKQTPRAPHGGFVAADEFVATEAWMGNHFFLCRG